MADFLFKCTDKYKMLKFYSKVTRAIIVVKKPAQPMKYKVQNMKIK